MTISAKIILDSRTSEGVRVTTFELRYPRYIHADLMTHRVFSRNASSSRAKPLKKFLEEETVFPIQYGSNISGMQAGKELSLPRRLAIKAIWSGMAWINGLGARAMANLGLHKQWVNRPIEWFTHINVLVTATDFNNFFALRYHPDAQPELTELARQMYELYSASRSWDLLNDNWHLPYITHKDILVASEISRTSYIQHSSFVRDIATELLIRVSVARCARVSYKSHDGKETTVEQDLALYDRLLAGVPLHASPAEHQCRPDYRYTPNPVMNDIQCWRRPELHGNLTGVIQYRKLLPGEHQKEFIPHGKVH